MTFYICPGQLWQTQNHLSFNILFSDLHLKKKKGKKRQTVYSYIIVHTKWEHLPLEVEFFLKKQEHPMLILKF